MTEIQRYLAEEIAEDHVDGSDFFPGRRRRIASTFLSEFAP